MPGLCRPLDEGGFGFDMKLNMAIPDLWIRVSKTKQYSTVIRYAGRKSEPLECSDVNLYAGWRIHGRTKSIEHFRMKNGASTGPIVCFLL